MAPIHEAAMAGDLEGVRLALAAGDDVDAVDHAPTLEVIGPATPLCYAAAFGRLEVASFLIKSRAVVKVADGSFGQTALHIAAYYLHADMVRRSLRHRPRCYLRVLSG